MTFKRLIWLSLFLWIGFATAGSMHADVKPIPKVSWGIYQIRWSPDQFEKELNQQLDQLGGNPKYVLFFRDLELRRGFPLKTVQICDRKNMTPVISFEPSPWGAPKTHDGLSAISSGRWDQYFQRWGHDAARWGKEVIFRYLLQLLSQGSGLSELAPRQRRHHAADFQEVGK